MITLSLDEYGDFEGVKKEVNDAVLIGGVMYDDKDAQSDLKNENLRIQEYYRLAIEKAKERMLEELNSKEVEIGISDKILRDVYYPRALHVSSKEDVAANILPGGTVGYVKNTVAETLGEFLKNGTFEGNVIDSYKDKGNHVKPIEGRKGEYSVYLILKSDEGKTSRMAKNGSKLFTDNYGSNLYFHMASETLQRTVFQNPLYKKESSFSLRIATRVSPTYKRNGKDNPLQAAYSELGYTKITKRPSGNDVVYKEDGKPDAPGEYYQLTNPDIYRTVVEQLMMQDNPMKSSIEELKVESMDYYQGKNQELLFLADSVCSFLSYRLNSEKRNTADAWMEEVSKRADKLLPKGKQLLFAYDVADIDFSKALDAYLHNDFYAALSISDDMLNKDGAFYEYYKTRWVPYIKNSVVNSDNVAAFIKAVKECHDSQLTNSYQQRKGLYIIRNLEKMVPRISGLLRDHSKQSIFYYLYETGMIAYCHMGNSEKAEEYYKKAAVYADKVPTEEFLRTRNMLVVSFSDDFKFEKALEIAEENCTYARLQVDVRRYINEQISVDGYLIESKAYSQCGQVYAFMRDKRAEELFEKALEMMHERSADYFITESYLLHHYIDMKDKEKYEDFSSEYFGNFEDLEEQLDYVFTFWEQDNPIINPKFALYLYMKALFCFYRDKITDSLWKKICTFGGLKEKEGHPMEFVYKYICLLAVIRKDFSVKEKYEGKISSAVGKEEGPIIKVITETAIKELLDLESNNLTDESKALTYMYE